MAPEGFILFERLEQLGELVRKPQSELDEAALGPDGPEVTLLSVATLIGTACPYDALPWPILSSRGEGPVLAAAVPVALDTLGGRKTATPGPTMTETLLAATLLPAFDAVRVPAGIAEAIATGAVDAGVLWDHSQCDLDRAGLVALEDLGARFAKYQSGLPIPLRVVAIRRDAVDSRAAIEVGLKAAMDWLEVDRFAAVTACAEALDAPPEAVNAYLRRTLDAHARLDDDEFTAALEVLREYVDADYYAANGRF